jgi:hypothetical protein
MLRIDKVIQPQGLITFRVAYTVILDDNGLYLIQTGPGFPPPGFTAGRNVARELSRPVIAMRTKKYMAESEEVEQGINRQGYYNFPLGKRGAFVTRSEIKSVKFTTDRYGSLVIKLKTAKGKFTLAFYAGLHNNSAVEHFMTQLTKP